MKSEKIKPSEYYRVLILRTVGNFLILSSLFFIGKTFYLPVQAEVRYFIDNQTQKEYVLAEDVEIDTQDPQPESTPSQSTGFARAFNLKRQEILTPKDTEFSIVVPKIAANAEIIPNVNAAREEEYLDALKLGVAHADGTAFPGEEGHIFLFAHSTDYFWNVGSYNAVFYLLYKLEPGDRVNLFHKGQRHVYQVTGKEVIEPDQVEYLTRKTNEEFLTLQTCWPPGTTLKRMLIFAEPVADVEKDMSGSSL